MANVILQPSQLQSATFNTAGVDVADTQIAVIANCTALAGLGTVTIQMQALDPVGGANWVNVGAALTVLNTAGTAQTLAFPNFPYKTVRAVCTITGTSITFSIVIVGKQQI